LLEELQRRSVPVLVPAGGHAVYIDAGRMLPHLAADENPGQALAAELYLAGGIRTTRLGLQTKHNHAAPRHVELVRLALPSRVYSTRHLEYVAEIAGQVSERASSIRGLSVTSSPKLLGGFLARYARSSGEGQTEQPAELGFGLGN
jgi:tryptophanase